MDNSTGKEVPYGMGTFGPKTEKTNREKRYVYLFEYSEVQ